MDMKTKIGLRIKELRTEKNLTHYSLKKSYFFQTTRF